MFLRSGEFRRAVNKLPGYDATVSAACSIWPPRIGNER
jgi:hypothetical protein